jgi:crotonobetainyl-CoA:carnitine CoA-transferase CaiB-like acyl-CoA transferase
MSGDGDLPLANLRAVVFTQAWAGAMTTMLLADLGATVIQIEALERPDPWRGGYAPRLSGTYPDNDPGERPYDRNANFNSVNTNKQGITIDLNHQEGKDLFLDLVRISDIVAENFSARVIPNFKLEYPVLRQVNPSVIMLRMPSYGTDGPYSMYMGNGGTTEPMSGISSLLGYKDGPPINSGVMHTDPVGGMFGYASLLIALHHRNRTGQGQLIDLSQQETSVHLITQQVMEYNLTGRVPPRQGNRDDMMVPHGNFRCRGEDSWVAIAVRSDAEWSWLCEVMGRAELAGDTRFSSLAGRLRNIDEVEGAVSEWTAGQESYAVMERLQAVGIPSAPVLNAADVLENPQLQARGFFNEVAHPLTGTYRHAGTPWRLANSPQKRREPSPTLGQHSVEVFRHLLGMPEREINRLLDQGITGETPAPEE